MTLMATPTGPQGYRGTYKGDVEEVTQARHDVSIILATWHLEQMIGPAQQVIAELMANAVAHTHEPDGRICRQDTVIMEMIRKAGGVRISVTDFCIQPPVEQKAAPTDESGRGLSLIAAFSSAWSWDPLFGGRKNRTIGKTVWADLAY